MAEQLDLPLSVNTKVADSITTQTINILRFAAGQQGKVVDMLKDLEGELIDALNKTVGTSTFTRGRLDALLKQTRDSIKTAYEQIDKSTQKGNEQVAKVTADKTVGALNTAVGAKVASVEWTAPQVKAIAENTIIKGSPASDWWDDQGEKLQASFEKEMQMGLLRGESIDDLTQRIRGTKENGYTDGIMNIPKSQAEALVRTSALGVSNQARMETYKANDQIIKGVQWVSTLDDRTTEECMALDGLTWEYPDGDGEADYVDYVPVDHDKEFEQPPIHFNCRSTVVPITYSWEELAADAEDGDEEAAAAADAIPDDEETRASMDGQVPATMSFEDWLGTKPEGFQNEVLGEKVADMWRAGDIDLKGLTDQSNNPLTIEQLQAKAGQPVEPEKARTEPLLTTEIRSKTENPNEGNNPSFEITFTDGNKAMFKPVEGESAFLVAAMVPKTPEMEGLTAAQQVAKADILPMADREVANSDIAKMVGMTDLVPNTVMRQVDGEWGSLQQWSFGSQNGMEIIRIDETLVDKHPEDIARAAAWDFFTGALDRHPGNYMVNEETGKITLIDNGISFGGTSQPPNSEMIDKAVEGQHPIPEEAVKQWVEKWPDIEAYMKDKGFNEREIGGARDRLSLLATNPDFAAVTEAADEARFAAPKSGAGSAEPPSEAAGWDLAAIEAERNRRLDAEIEAQAAKEAKAQEEAEQEARIAAKLEAMATKAAPPATPYTGPGPGMVNLEATVVNQTANPSSGVNTSYVLDLADGGKAVYKPVSGEDFRIQSNLGVPEGRNTMAAREVATSDVAKIIDFDLVPNTIMRWEEGTKEGSVQEWLPGYKNAVEWPYGQVYEAVNTNGQISQEEHARIAAFDWFTGQGDRHAENFMIHPETGKVALIDNGISFAEHADIDSQPLTFAKLHDIPIPEEVKEWQAKWPEVKDYLEQKGFSPLEIEKTQFRLDDMVNRQAAGQTFTDVGSGREIPAPPPAPEPPPPAEPEPKPLPDLEQPIASVKANESSGVNNSYVVEFEDGSKGIYKPIEGETLAVGGKDENKMGVREVAASDMAKILGMDEIPHTIMTTVDNPAVMFSGEGSMQEMLTGYKNAGEFEVKERYDLIGPEAHARMAAFDYLINNGDRHDNNWMIHPETGKLGMIDNGYSMATDPTLFNSRPFGWAAHLELPIPPEVATEWTSKWPEIEVYLRTKGFDTKEIEATAERLNHLADATTFMNVLPPDSLAYRVNEMMRQVQDKAWQEEQERQAQAAAIKAFAEGRFH